MDTDQLTKYYITSCFLFCFLYLFIKCRFSEQWLGFPLNIFFSVGVEEMVEKLPHRYVQVFSNPSSTI